MGTLASYNRLNERGESGVLVHCLAIAPPSLSLSACTWRMHPRVMGRSCRGPDRGSCKEGDPRALPRVRHYSGSGFSDEQNRPKSQPAFTEIKAMGKCKGRNFS